MANKEHVRILGNSVVSLSTKSWNQWRMENPGLLPDLSGEDLSHTDLSFINLSNADLRYADLSNSNLHHANLQKADLRGSKLQHTDLSGADLCFAHLMEADLSAANLNKAVMRSANLQGAKLDQADMRGADMLNALIDPGVFGQSNGWLSHGISIFEKIALGLAKRKPAHKHPHKAGTQEHKQTHPRY